MSTNSKVRVAFVGMRHGHIGKIGPKASGYIEAIRQLEGAETVAYCEDVEPERLEEAKKYDPNASRYSSLDELLAKEEFEMAMVSGPAAWIPPTGIKLAEAGKHFFMEKQFARRAEDLAELVRAVRKNGVKVLPGYPHRFNPVCQELKRLIDQGIFGKPLDIEVRLNTTQVRPGLRDPGRILFTDKDEGGGILHMLGGHYLEVMRFLMGCEIKAVQAMTGRPVGNMDGDLEDVAICAYEYENGAYGSMHAGYLRALKITYDTTLVYRGSEGEADWTPIGGPTLKVKSAVPAWSGAPERTFDLDLPTYEGYGGTIWMRNWLQRFVDDIRADREPALKVEDALHVLQSIDAAYESARTGKRVEVKYGA